MSCPKTTHLMQEYFSDDLAPVASEELEKHLRQCADCNAELTALMHTRSKLGEWREERAPHWDRGMELFRREHRATSETSGFWSRWQWFPTAASFAMLCLMLFNTTVISTEQGVSISFAEQAPPAAQLQSQLADFAAAQRAEMQTLIARFEERQDSNNVQLLQAMMDQTQQTTAENLERIYAYFEQQRLQDLQDMRASYQQLVDSDYQTIRSLEQLAQYVSYEENLR